MDLTDKNFEEEVLKSDIPVLVEFWGSWCPPCKMMAPLLEQLAKEYEGRVKIKKLNTDRYPAPADGYDIMGVPTFILFKEGQEAGRRVAAQTKEMLKEFIGEVL